MITSQGMTSQPEQEPSQSSPSTRRTLIQRELISSQQDCTMEESCLQLNFKSQPTSKAERRFQKKSLYVQGNGGYLFHTLPSGSLIKASDGCLKSMETRLDTLSLEDKTQKLDKETEDTGSPSTYSDSEIQERNSPCSMCKLRCTVCGGMWLMKKMNS